MTEPVPTQMGSLLRVYEPSECGSDGYPFAWHAGIVIAADGPVYMGRDLIAGGGIGVKHLVRELAGHRCVRCLHPFVCGETPGKWSPCDQRCAHGGPVRTRPSVFHDWVEWPAVPEGGFAPSARVEALQRILTVHHLRLGNDAKRDLRWWNLAALCQRCHLQIQGKVQMERVWPHEHSEWFKPYAAGWYAWSYLGLELTREQTEARLDELLALELVA